MRHASGCFSVCLSVCLSVLSQQTLRDPAVAVPAVTKSRSIKSNVSTEATVCVCACVCLCVHACVCVCMHVSVCMLCCVSSQGSWQTQRLCLLIRSACPTASSRRANRMIGVVWFSARDSKPPSMQRFRQLYGRSFLMVLLMNTSRWLPQPRVPTNRCAAMRHSARTPCTELRMWSNGEG